MLHDERGRQVLKHTRQLARAGRFVIFPVGHGGDLFQSIFVYAAPEPTSPAAPKLLSPARRAASPKEVGSSTPEVGLARLGAKAYRVNPYTPVNGLLGRVKRQRTCGSHPVGQQ